MLLEGCSSAPPREPPIDPDVARAETRLAEQRQSLQRCEQFPGREPRQESHRRVDEIRLRDRTKGFRTVSLRSQHKAGVGHLRECLVCARNLRRRLIEVAAESDVRR